MDRGHHIPGTLQKNHPAPTLPDVKSGSQGAKGQQQPSQKRLGHCWGGIHTWEQGQVLDEGKGSAGGPLGQRKDKQRLRPQGP